MSLDDERAFMKEDEGKETTIDPLASGGGGGGADEGSAGDERQEEVAVGEDEDPFAQPAAKPQHQDPVPAATAEEEEEKEKEAPVAPAAAATTTSSSLLSATAASSSSAAILEEQPSEQSDLTFRVCDPRMTLPNSAMDLAYWIYQVVTKTSLQEWGGANTELKQARRFSDFLWLRDELCSEYPGAIMPPLPEKNVKGQFEKIMLTNVDLLSFRQRALTRFLMAVGRHHLAKSSPHLKAFCQLIDAEWEEYKASTKKNTPPSAGVVQKGKESWFKMFKKGKGGDEGGATGKTAPGDSELQQRKQYVKEMEDSLGVAHDRMKKHIENRAETAKAMSELSSYLTSTGELECRADDNLGTDLKNSGAYTSSLAKIHQEQASKERLLVLEVLGYYIGMFCAVKEEIRRVQRLGITMCTLQDELASAETAARKASGEKRVKADQHRDNIASKEAAAKSKYDAAKKLFDEEWEQFHARKKRDFKNLQKTFVGIQISYSRQQESLQHAPIQPAVFTQD